MATYTSNYGWTKPSGSDNVDISVLNDNLDDQDSTIHDAFLNMAPPFSESSTYAVDDIVLYGTGLYKCHTAVVTPGSWTGSANWQVHKLSEGGSGGTSNYNDLTNKPSINGVTLSGNKTTSDLGINADNVMMSDGETSVESEINKYNSLIDNPLAHNGIYTGRNLGTISSASDWAAFRAKYGIADKSYKGLYLGDYVKVNDGTYNADWMVAGFNTETNKGKTNIIVECVYIITIL